MIRFTQYLPTYCEGFELKGFEADNIYNLLENPFFQKIREKENFSHFALNKKCIMGIFDDGFSWWVYGGLHSDDPIDLPEWGGWKFRAVLDGKEVFLDKEVVSACGNVLTLRDGKTAIDMRGS